LIEKEEIKKSKIYGLHGRGGYHLPKVSLFIAPPLPTNPYLCAIYGMETVQGAVPQLREEYFKGI
jgi:hypothetical protein